MDSIDDLRYLEQQDLEEMGLDDTSELWQDMMTIRRMYPSGTEA